MTGTLTMTGQKIVLGDTGAIVFNRSTSTDWSSLQNSGIRILNTAGYSRDGAPTNYSVGLSVQGYYGFQLACCNADNDFRMRSTSAGSDNYDPLAWVTLLHSGNYSTYCAAASHTHSYLPLSGGTMSGAITMGNGARRFILGPNVYFVADFSADTGGWADTLLGVKDKDGVKTLISCYGSNSSGLNYGTLGGVWNDPAARIYMDGFEVLKSRSITPSANNSYYCGGNSYKWAAVYSNQFIKDANSTNILLANGNTLAQSTFAGSGHNHDSTYLKLSGGTMAGDIVMTNMNNGIRYKVNYLAGWARSFITFYQHTDSDSSKEIEGVWGIGTYGDVDGYRYTYIGGDEYSGEKNLRFYKNGDIKIGSNIIYHAGNLPAYPTLSSLGAAAANHNHDGIYLKDNYYGNLQTDIPTDWGNGLHRVHRPGTEFSSVLVGHDGNGSYWQLYFHPTSGYSQDIKYRATNCTSWKTLLDTNNYSTYCAAVSHTHSYLPLAGGQMTGQIVSPASPFSAYPTAGEYSGGIQLREYNCGGSSIDLTQFNAPGITFHWSGRYANKLYLNGNDGQLYYGGGKVWTSSNDGSGSGLDADTLDGNHASAFATAGHTHSYLPLSGGYMSGHINNDGEYTYIGYMPRKTSGGGGWAYDVVSCRDPGDTRFMHLGVYGGDTSLSWIYLGPGEYYSENNLRISSSGVSWGSNVIYHAGNLPAYPTKASWNYDDVYLKLSGGSLTGSLSVTGSVTVSDKFIFPHGGSSYDWSRINEGYSRTSIRAYCTAGETATGARDKYSIGLMVDGYYSFALAAYGGGAYLSWRDNSGTWRDIIHAGNYTSYCATSSHNHDSTYLKLAGGTMTGDITMTDMNVGIRYKVNYLQGWARDFISFYQHTDSDSTKELSKVWAIGTYGDTDGYRYSYIGGGSYDSGNNLRFYKNGDVKIGDNIVYHAGNHTSLTNSEIDAIIV